MIKEMAAGGAKWVRVEFFAEYGDLGGPGVFNWQKYDWFLTDLCPRYGMNVLGVLSYGIVRDTNPAYLLNKLNESAGHRRRLQPLYPRLRGPCNGDRRPLQRICTGMGDA